MEIGSSRIGASFASCVCGTSPDQSSLVRTCDDVEAASTRDDTRQPAWVPIHPHPHRFFHLHLLGNTPLGVWGAPHALYTLHSTLHTPHQLVCGHPNSKKQNKIRGVFL